MSTLREALNPAGGRGSRDDITANATVDVTDLRPSPQPGLSSADGLASTSHGIRARYAARSLDARAAQQVTKAETGPAAGPVRKKLPAYGRALKAALTAGLRPRKAGGGIVVTTDWNYARAFDPGRIVCPPGEPVERYDFSFLAGCPVVVVVPARDERYGELLVAHLRDAGASLVVLAVNREDSP